MANFVSKPQFTKSTFLKPSEDLSSLPPFSSEIRQRAPGLHAMVIQDPSHYLFCELILEVQKGRHESEYGIVICQFPKISDEKLKIYVNEDETLSGMIMIRFQMKIMEQLLIFCTHQRASNLIIYVDDDQAKTMGIYQDFVVSEDHVVTPVGEKTEMIVLTDPEIFDDWMQYMNQVTILFQQTLWQDQSGNPAIRRYLKSYEISKF